MIESTDNGVSWSDPRVVIHTPLDNRDAGVLETAKGTILVTTFTSILHEDILARAEKVKPGEKDAWSEARLKRCAGPAGDHRRPAPRLAGRVDGSFHGRRRRRGPAC